MPEPRKLKKPVEEIRAELLADVHTQNIAKKLGLSTEDYVEKVIHYAVTGEEPKLNVLPDAEVKANGGATVDDVKAWLNDAISGKVAIGPKHLHDGFEPAKPQKK